MSYKSLARRMRPTNFSSFVGHDLVVSILRNSLYTGKIFPVYILAGMHGSGKTTIGRIMSAALQCNNLGNFQKNPQESVPCGQCQSCAMIAAQTHPDCIELDAASHTGVETMRGLIDSALLAPTVGKYRVYLIDEAHMLSKASFNALLKLLEEPPRSAVFMLATTELHKIIPTIRSRAFTLVFNPVSRTAVQEHLQAVAQKENMHLDADAAAMIATASKGSVRDALTILEQCHAAYTSITVDQVQRFLGVARNDQLEEFLQAVVASDVDRVAAIAGQAEEQGLDFSVWWQQLTQLVLTKIKEAKVDRDRLLSVLERMYRIESWIVKSVRPYGGLLLLCGFQSQDIEEVSSFASPKRSPTQSTPNSVKTAVKKEPIKPKENVSAVVAPVQNTIQEETATISPQKLQPQMQSNDPVWNDFLQAIAQLNDNVLASIFAQAQPEITDSGLTLAVYGYRFYQNYLEEKRGTWYRILSDAYSGATITLELRPPAAHIPKKIEHTVPAQAKSSQQNTTQKSFATAPSVKNKFKSSGKAVSSAEQKTRVVSEAEAQKIKEENKQINDILDIFEGNISLS